MTGRRSDSAVSEKEESATMHGPRTPTDRLNRRRAGTASTAPAPCRAIRRLLQVVALRRHAHRRHPGARAHRVADAVVQGLASALHRPRVEAVRERRADHRRPRWQPAVRRRLGQRRGRRLGRARRRDEVGRGRLQRLHARSPRGIIVDRIKVDQPASCTCERDATAGTWRASQAATAGIGPEVSEARDLAAVDRDLLTARSRSTIARPAARHVCRAAWTISTSKAGSRVRSRCTTASTSITSASTRRRRNWRCERAHRRRSRCATTTCISRSVVTGDGRNVIDDRRRGRDVSDQARS